MLVIAYMFEKKKPQKNILVNGPLFLRGNSHMPVRGGSALHWCVFTLTHTVRFISVVPMPRLAHETYAQLSISA